MIISILAKPNSSCNKVEKIGENSYIVYTTVLPEKGLANKMIIKLLSKEMKLAKSNFHIKAGLKSSNKLIEIK